MATGMIRMAFALAITLVAYTQASTEETTMVSLGNGGCSNYLEHRSAGTEQVYYSGNSNSLSSADQCRAQCASTSWCVHAFWGLANGGRDGDCGLYGRCDLSVNTKYDAFEKFAPTTGNPTPGPTENPTPGPTINPTPGPTGNPTPGPTTNPTPGPTGNPTPGPTSDPTPGPTSQLDELGAAITELSVMVKENNEELREIKGLLNQHEQTPSCYGRRVQE
jgi:hypothetical protein